MHGWQSGEQKIWGIWKWELNYLLWTRGTFLGNFLSLLDDDNSFSRTNNFVNANVFNSVTSSQVLSYQKSKLCKKLIYETITALINYNAGHLDWQHMRSDIYGAKIPFPWCTKIIGRKSHLKNRFSVELLYHKHINMFQQNKKVKPFLSGLVFGWVNTPCCNVTLTKTSKTVLIFIFL